jgi:hypothetical protein
MKRFIVSAEFAVQAPSESEALAYAQDALEDLVSEQYEDSPVVIKAVEDEAWEDPAAPEEHTLEGHNLSHGRDERD